MKKLLQFIIAVLFITKANAQCSVATQSLSENFTVVPPCWFPIGTGFSAGIFDLSPGLSGQETMILPKTINAKGILEFDVKNITNSNPTITLLIGAVSSQISTAMSSFQPIKYLDVPTAVSGMSIVWAHYSIDLSNYEGSYQFIALSLVGGTMNPTLQFDNVTYNSACISTSVTAAAQNYTVQLNNKGLAYVTPSNINNGSTSSCGTPNLRLNQSTFSCSNVGVNTVTLTAIDSGSNTATATASVTVLPAINDETVTVLQNAVCLGNSTTITTGASVTGIKYYLRDDATNAIVAGPITGNGSPLSFNTGTLTSNTTFNVYAETQTGVNNALDFDGVNDVVTTSLSSAATNSLTLEAWIFPRATTYKRIISCYTNDLTTSGEFLLDTYNATNNGRGLRIAVEGANNSMHQLSAANVLTLNAWNHVAGTFNNGVTTLYVNGNVVATSTASFTSIPRCTNKITIAEDPIILPSILVYFNGKMDEIRIWNTARTQAEIAGNRNNCLIGNEIGLTNYFKISENGGSTVTDIKTNSVGTMSGMTPATAWVTGNVNCINTACNQEMTSLITVSIAPNPTITVNSGTICAGSSFTITPSGANTYTIQGGSAVKTPTSNTTYTVIGTSSVGCISSTFATSSVSVNTTPTITVNSGSICSGNSFTITPSGAITYTYSNGNIVSPLANTNYTVSGTSSNGCINSTVSSVTVNATPTISVNSGGICIGNNFTITPSGANTYTIEGGNSIVNPTTNATYTVAGTATNGCVSNTFAISNVTVNPIPTISVNSGSICEGESFTITPNGANSYTIQGGNTVVNPAANASYTVVGTSVEGCKSSTFATSNVTVNILPTINAITSNTIICTGETATLTANGASTYSWNPGSVGNTISVSPTITTIYTVTGTDANGCSNNTAITQSVSLCTGINNITTNNNTMTLFPNPSSSILTIQAIEEIKAVYIFNTLGDLVRTEKTNTFSVEQLSSGIYMIHVKTEKGINTLRFVRE